MANGTLGIKELHLRVPGLSAEEGRKLGQEVVQRVADRLPASDRPRRLEALGLCATVPEGTSRDQMASLIAEAILGGIV